MAAPWQLECENMEQRCGYLLTSGLWSDCTFAVGAETNQAMVPAHKLVVAMASPVFAAMFYGGFSERNDPIVPIPDVTPEAFAALLQYIYTGNISIGSFNMACDLWLSADKYMLPHLVTECNKYIKSVLGPRNCCRTYELASLFNDKSLMDKCIQIISTNTKEVLNDHSFEEVELNTLITVCSLNHLTVDSELDMFHAVARYAEAEQRRQGQISPADGEPQIRPADGEPPTKELSEKVMLPSSSDKSPAAELESKPSTEGVSSKQTKDKEEEPSIHTALQKIRFLSLSAEQFAEGPARSSLLTKDETLALVLNIASKNRPVPMPPGFSECRERRKTRGDSQKQCFEAGSLDHTIHALKCGDPSQVTAAVMAALDILSTDTPDDFQGALDKGILDALVPALTEGDDDCKYNAADAIHCLCFCGTPSQLSMLAASAALEPFCRLLTSTWGDTCFAVLSVLTELLKKVEHNTKVALLRKLREIGVRQLLITVQRDGDEYEREPAADLLRTYFDNEQ